MHVDELFNQALQLSQDGQRDQAMERYRQALATHPEHLASRINLGILLAQQGRRREAIEQAVSGACNDATCNDAGVPNGLARLVGRLRRTVLYGRISAFFPCIVGAAN